MAAEWRFLVDENPHPQIVDYLENEDITAAYVPDVLFEGADDDEDIILVYDGKLEAFGIVSGSVGHHRCVSRPGHAPRL